MSVCGIVFMSVPVRKNERVRKRERKREREREKERERGREGERESSSCTERAHTQTSYLRSKEALRDPGPRIRVLTEGDNDDVIPNEPLSFHIYWGQ